MISDADAPSSANRVANVCRNACKLAPDGTRSCNPAHRKHDRTKYSNPPRPIGSPCRSRNNADPRSNRARGKRPRHDTRYSSITRSIAGSIGTERSRPPLPATCNRRSPGRPTTDPNVNIRISADRNPATNPNANTSTSRSGHGSRAFRTPSAAAANNRSGVSSPRNGFGTNGGVFGRATAPIGFPATNSSATQNVKNWFHVDHARNTDDFACESANTPNAARRFPAVRSSTTNPSTDVDTASANNTVIPARSRRYAAVV